MNKDKRFVLSDGNSVNSNGYRVDINGLDLTRFKSNPIMLYEHNPQRVIGRWKDIQKGDQKLTAAPDFDTEDVEVLSIAGKVERGFINGASIGIIVFKIQNIDGVDVVTKSELFEASIVAVPADAGAVRLYNDQLECLTIEKLKLSINKQKQKEMDYKECYKQVCDALGLDPDTDIKTVVETIGKLSQANGGSEIKEALSLDILTVSESKHYEKMLKGGALDVLQIIAEKKQDYLKKQERGLIDLYNANSDKIITYLTLDGWKDVKRLGFDAAKKIVDNLPERIFLSKMVADKGKGAKNLDWYRKNNPQALQDNPELYQSLLKDYKSNNN